VRFAALERLARVDLPVLLDLGAAVPPAEEMPRRQLPDPLEDRRVARRVEEREVMIERGHVQRRIDGAGGEQRLDLAAEVEAPAREVDDAQAAHAEADPRLDMNPLVVGTAMPDHLAHAMDQAEFSLQALGPLSVPPAAGAVREPRYATHV